MLMSLLQVLFKELYLLLAFGLAGLPISLIVFKRYALRLMIAPFVGVLGFNVVILGIYFVFDLSFRTSLVGALMVFVGFWLAFLLLERPWRKEINTDWPPLVLMVVFGVCCAVLVNMAEIVNHGPATVMIAGTDQAGYATNADWILNHVASDHPRSNPYDTGQIHSVVVFTVHARMLPFSALATASVLLGTPTFFSYQALCAVALAAGILAVAATVTSRALLATAAMFALMSSYWFEYAYSGFLGKLIAFPAAIAIATVLLQHFDRRYRLPSDPLSVLFCIILLAGVALSHSAQAAILFLGAIAGSYMAGKLVLRGYGHIDQLIEEAALISLCVFVFVMSAGLLTRHLPSNTMPQDVGEFSVILGFVLDTPQRNLWLAAGAIVAQAGLIVLAIQRHTPSPLALAVGPILVVLAFWAIDAQPLLFQLAGYAYPAAVCGMAMLADQQPWAAKDRPQTVWQAVAVMCAIALGMILVRATRFQAAVQHFADPVSSRQRVFLASEFDQLAHEIKIVPFRVEVNTPHAAVALMAGLERRVRNLQWGEDPWRHVGGYASVVLPRYQRPTERVLYSRGDPRADGKKAIVTTANFVLVEWIATN